MDEGDRELYLEEQVDEDGCLEHVVKALDMLRTIGGIEVGVGRRMGEMMTRAGEVMADGLQG